MTKLWAMMVPDESVVETPEDFMWDHLDEFFTTPAINPFR